VHFGEHHGKPGVGRIHRGAKCGLFPANAMRPIKGATYYPMNQWEEAASCGRIIRGGRNNLPCRPYMGRFRPARFPASSRRDFFPDERHFCWGFVLAASFSNLQQGADCSAAGIPQIAHRSVMAPSKSRLPRAYVPAQLFRTKALISVPIRAHDFFPTRWKDRRW